jgi:DNA (cytosine-5)-methyltransferase 1
MARLHGFPDWFRLHETKWHGARQIGNSVPPPLARAIAEQIVSALGIEPVRPLESVDLGNIALLKMHISEAAAYWNVPVVMGRRDKKSGAKKRKQQEIEQERLAAAEMK